MELSWETFCIRSTEQGREIEGLDQLKLLDARYVYVIETPEDLTIKYKSGVSNICYIGRQSERVSGSRAYAQARGWIARFLILSQSTSAFRISVCHPRQRGYKLAYREVEAFLIAEFVEKFGQRPIFNRRSEIERASFDIIDNSNLFRKMRKEGVIDASIGIDAEASI